MTCGHTASSNPLSSARNTTFNYNLGSVLMWHRCTKYEFKYYQNIEILEFLKPRKITIDVPSVILYASQSISALSWVVAMYTTMPHISCLISALWLHHITYKGSNTPNICTLLHSVTEQPTKSIDMLYKNTLGVKKARPRWKHQLLLISACDQKM